MLSIRRIAHWAGTLLVLTGAPCQAQEATPAPTSKQASPRSVVSCTSKEGERTQCAADTSAGVLLLKSTGTAACLLGKTWGYDQTTVWVSDGCSAEFGTGTATAPDATSVSPPRHVPNVGFLLLDGDKGQIYMRLFT